MPVFWPVSAMLGAAGRTPLHTVWIAAASTSILAHELGHAFAARAFGGTARIEMHAMGGTTYPSATPALSAWQWVAVYLAGPGAGLLLGDVVFALSRLADLLESGVASTAVAGLLWLNWGYGLVNLLPIVPLDGGQVMRVIIERARGRPSPTVTAVASLAVAAALAAYAFAAGCAYDVACAHSRLGRIDEAVAWLERSVEAGYRDAAHLDADPDLEAARGHAGYAAVRARLDSARDASGVGDPPREPIAPERATEEVA